MSSSMLDECSNKCNPEEDTCDEKNLREAAAPFNTATEVETMKPVEEDTSDNQNDGEKPVVESKDESTTTAGDDHHHSESSGFVGREVFEQSRSNMGQEEEGSDEADATPEMKKSTAGGNSQGDDPFDLRRRFVRTHGRDFGHALQEIQQGQKRSCWSWYIFPCAPWVVNGMERGSYTNQQYCLRDLGVNKLKGVDAARAYLKFPTENGVNLRQNYIDIMSEVTHQVKDKGVSVRSLVGVLDDPKLRSSVKHFELISRDDFDAEVNAVCVACLKAMKEEPYP